MPESKKPAKPVTRERFEQLGETQALIEKDLAKYVATRDKLKKRKRNPIRIHSADKKMDDESQYATDAIRNHERNLERVKTRRGSFTPQ